MNEAIIVPLGMLIFYWLSLTILGIIAGVGWTKYMSIKKKNSASIPVSTPLSSEVKGTAVINKPKNIKDNQSHIGV